MPNLVLIHWKAEEAQSLIDLLSGAGYIVQVRGEASPAMLRELEANPPAAVLIDLSRSPSHGREAGVSLRVRKGTSHIPLVFLGGLPEKVATIRELLPDAVFTSEVDLLPALQSVATAPVQDPVRPASVFAAYEGRPVIQKLGIKAGMRVGLVGAPEAFETSLGEIPPDVEWLREPGDACDLWIWFPGSEMEMRAEIAVMRERVRPAHVWIAWRKKTKGNASSLVQMVVREVGLANGLVDYKICAIDDIWSALKFKIRS